MRLGMFLSAVVLASMVGCGGDGVETVGQGKSNGGSATSGADTPAAGDAANGEGDGKGPSGSPGDGKRPAGDGQGGAGGTKRGTIGLSVLTLNNPFFKVIGDHMTEEAAKHGYDVIVVSGDQDPNKQLEQVQDFINKGCVAIVLVPCKSEVPAAIQAANKAGIPVFTTDSASLAQDVKIESHIGTDNYQGGRLAGQAMLELLGESGGEVAILDYPEAESCKLRVKGFTEVIDEHNAKPDAAKIEIVIKLDALGDQEAGERITKDILQAHDNLKAIFAINDPSGLGAYAALQNAGREKDIKIIAFDGQREGKLAIRDGKFYADPIQYPGKMGVTTAQVIAAFFRGEEIQKEILIPTTLYKQADAEQDPDLK